MRFTADDPVIAQLKEEAAEALSFPDFNLAERKLNEISQNGFNFRCARKNRMIPA